VCRGKLSITGRGSITKYIIEDLQPAERSLQEAIVAYIEDDQTLARIRFRQARDTFEDAHETITGSEEDLLIDPIEVSVQPDRELSSLTLSDLQVISEKAASALADAGIETVDELESSTESPWTPPKVAEVADSGAINDEEMTILTLLSWWYDDDSCEFDTAEAIERRQQQADHGFRQTS
jgi:hypothetical protein